MRHKFSRATLLILLSVLCIQPIDSFAGDAALSKNPPSRVKLGVIAPLTGPLAFFGQDFIRAYKIAEEDYPHLKERIHVVWEDSAYDSKKAVAAFSKLTTVDKVDVVYSFGGPMLSALAPLAERQKVPFFATESQKSDCQGRDYCSLFRNEEDEWGEATWSVLRKRGLKRIGIVKNQNQFMNTFVDAIINTKRADETVEILVDVPPDATDLRSEVLNLKAAQIDALGIYLLPNSHRGFLNAWRGINRTVPLFGVEEFLDVELNQGFDEVIDGTLVIAPGSSDEYRKKFEDRFGDSAGFFYTPAFYDFLMLLQDIATRHPIAKGVELVQALRFDGQRSGVSGAYSVRKSEAGVYSYSFPIFVYELSDGEASIIDRVSFDS